MKIKNVSRETFGRVFFLGGGENFTDGKYLVQKVK